MKTHQIHQWGGVCLAILVCAILTPAASASVIGTLSVQNCSGGGVTVTATSIDWLPDVVAGTPPVAINCLALGVPTNITSIGDGSLTPTSPSGTINDLPAPPPSTIGFPGFMSFTGAGIHLLFDLTGLGPGVSTPCTSGMANGAFCSVFPGSPFILTVDGNNTSVSLHAFGTIQDSNGAISDWQGSFTTQLPSITPIGVQAEILSPGGAISNTYSGSFDVTARAAVPEPGSLALLGGGLIAFAAVRRRRLRA